MTQSDGYNTLKRVSLNLKTEGTNRWYHFKINPEEYQEQYSQRSNVFRTREALVLEDFGPDVGKITFSGTTGFRSIEEYELKGSPKLNGAQRLFRLEELLKEYSLSSRTSEPGENPNNAELLFYNNTDNKAWYVHLDEDGFSIERTAEESLLYRYSISLIILRETTEPLDREIDDVDIGNPIDDGDFHLHPDTIPKHEDKKRDKKPAKNPNGGESFYEEYLRRSGQLVGYEDLKAKVGGGHPHSSSPIGELVGKSGGNKLARPKPPWVK